MKSSTPMKGRNSWGDNFEEEPPVDEEECEDVRYDCRRWDAGSLGSGARLPRHTLGFTYPVPRPGLPTSDGTRTRVASVTTECIDHSATWRG